MSIFNSYYFFFRRNVNALNEVFSHLIEYQKQDHLETHLVSSRAGYQEASDHEPQPYFPSESDLKSNIIAFGKPDENLVTEILLNDLGQQNEDLLERFQLVGESIKTYQLRTPDGALAESQRSDAGNLLSDMGYLLKAPNPKNVHRSVYLISGSDSIGAHAAVKVGLNPQKYGLSQLNSPSPFEFWVSCDVQDGLFPINLKLEEFKPLKS